MTIKLGRQNLSQNKWGREDTVWPWDVTPQLTHRHQPSPTSYGMLSMEWEARYSCKGPCVLRSVSFPQSWLHLFFQAQGYTRQQITFNGSVHITQIGHANLHIDAYDEEYLQTLPSVTIKSLFSGSPYPELNGLVYIYSSSGYTAKIDFSGTSMLGLAGNKKNTVRAVLYKTGDEKNRLYEI